MTTFFSTLHHAVLRFVQELSPKFKSDRNAAVTEFVNCEGAEKVTKARALMRFFHHHPEVVMAISNLKGDCYERHYYQNHLAKINGFPHWSDLRERQIIRLITEITRLSTRYSEIYKVAGLQAELDEIGCEFKTYFETPANHEELLNNDKQIDFLQSYMRQHGFHRHGG